jgi:hypothetical protein
MTMPERWKRQPKPDEAVLDLAEELVKAACSGQVRAVVIVTMNPNLHVECGFAGLSDEVRRRLIHSGLVEAAEKALIPPSE